jgi:ketosteroid isomerase-like protein
VLSEAEVRKFAAEWIQAWNSHNLEAIMSHYSPEVVLISPTAAKLLGDSSGTIKGKQAVRGYFEKGLQAFPSLTFELLDVMWGISSVVLYYVNQKGTKTGEFMELDANRKVSRVVANYN